MTDKPLIWALDLAVIIGWASGRLGDKPVARSIPLSDGTTDDLFHSCYAWFDELLEREQRPDVLAIEALLPPTARIGHTNTGAQHRLAGMHGIVRALARRAGIAEVMTASVSDVRGHFIHHRNMRRAEAKRAVSNTCRLLGWHAPDNNAADALALWSYTVAILNPAYAVRTTPLFGTWEEVAKARESRRS